MKMMVSYIIASEEADSQCKSVFLEGKEPTLLITGDSDLLAYGHRRVMIVGSWKRELFCFFNLTASELIPFLSFNGIRECTKCLVAGYFQQSELVLQLFTACCGCDFMPDKAGLPGIGIKTVIAVLKEILEDETEILSTATFARCIFESGQLKGGLTYDDVTQYIASVIAVYSAGACFYTETYCIQQLDGTIVEGASELS